MEKKRPIGQFKNGLFIHHCPVDHLTQGNFLTHTNEINKTYPISISYNSHYRM